MARYFILACDGGGIRGYITASVLQLADPTVTPNAWTPIVLGNLRGSPFESMLAWEAGLCSSAAPVYFPPYRPTSAPLGYCVDGGVFANNPSLFAMSAAIADGALRKDICLLSLNTGTVADSMPASVIDGWGGPLHMGPLQWLWPKTQSSDGNYTPKFPLLLALLDASSESIALSMRMLLGDRYCRVTVPLPAAVMIDDASDASYATMNTALDSFYASPAFAATTAWLAKYAPAGAAISGGGRGRRRRGRAS